ncbi:MAG: hypothetical protein LJE69_18305, partial [Thiohalocapsa sp.]|uniref:hypothetical protein n=1 Tax=Thiohalocapsa sp. TaxID=2497641 RepID=UPI0025D8ABDD
MKRIIPVLGTSMLFAFAIGAQAEQALTGGQMDVITAGHDYTQDPYQGDKGDPKEGDSSLYLT